MMSGQIKHIGIIIDGNRRYSKKNNMSFEEVYKLGAKKVYEVIRFVFDQTDIAELTIYALSYDNLLRKSKEIDTVLNVQKEEFDGWAVDPFFKEKDIRVRFVGELNILPREVQASCTKLAEQTAKSEGKTLNILLAYFGDKELVRAVENIIKLKDSLGKGKELNIEELVWQNLSVKHPVDMIIRTGGGSRLSGFLPWHSEYAELYTLDKLWPEIQISDVKDAIAYYQGLEMKKGK